MVNVFSFCLYGPEKRIYYQGMLENIDVIETHYPDWKIYIYYAPDVTPGMMETLRSHASVRLRPTNVLGAVNMIHRFFAIDEEDVDVMFSRDADSRIHEKDRWAIGRFLESSQLVHCIRDNIAHNVYMMGGLWGIKKSAGISIREKYEEFKQSPTEYGIGLDQNFLCDKIYPLVIDRVLAHYSFENCHYEREQSEKFPFEWSNDIYCGRVEGEAWEPSRWAPPKVSFRSASVRVGDAPTMVAPAPATRIMVEPTITPKLTNLLRKR